MVAVSVQRLHYLIDTIPLLLSRIPENDFSHQPSPEKWSKKEILGHLIDSATNNHQRFIRVQFEEEPAIRYNQNEWNTLSHYNQKDSDELIRFWTLYNRHLAHLIQYMPEASLKRTCKSGEPSPVTLEWLIDDYVKHLEHHLHQIVEYR